MHSLSLIALVVIVVGVTAGWVVRRFSDTAGGLLTLTTNVAARLAVFVICGVISVRAFERGGGWIALGIGVGLVALLSLVLAGLLGYGLLIRSSDDTAD